MKIKRPKWVFPSSFIFGWHFGYNPVNGQKFGCIGLGLLNIDIEYPEQTLGIACIEEEHLCTRSCYGPEGHKAKDHEKWGFCTSSVCFEEGGHKEGTEMKVACVLCGRTDGVFDHFEGCPVSSRKED